jgi:hypothetical protein
MTHLFSMVNIHVFFPSSFGFLPQIFESLKSKKAVTGTQQDLAADQMTGPYDKNKLLN